MGSEMCIRDSLSTVGQVAPSEDLLQRPFETDGTAVWESSPYQAQTSVGFSWDI